MPTVSLPLTVPPYYNTEPIAESIASDDMYDVYLEPVPGIGLITRRRPGLVKFSDVGTNYPGDGLFYWEQTRTLIAVSGGKVFSVGIDGKVTQLTGKFTGAPGTKAVFAAGQKLDGSPWLYIAATGLNYTTDGKTLLQPTDPNTPRASHVGWINGRFVANEIGTNRFDFTDTNPATGDMDNAYWSATENPLTCDARGDNLVTLFTAWQEINCWGSAGLEIWQDDGATPFVPLQSAYAELGIEAAYAYNRIDNTIFALCVADGKRVIVRLESRSPKIISEPIAKQLADMKDVYDARCDVISPGGIALALFTFPSAGESWAYDYKNDTWTRWGSFDTSTGKHGRFIGQNAAFAKGWNRHVIQSSVDSSLYFISRDYYTDAGNPLVTYRRTGWVDHGTWKRKRVSQLFIKGKVFVKNGKQPAELMVRWRDDGTPVWGNWLTLSLNPDQQGNFVFPMNRLGMYRSRQYEFRIVSPVDLALIGAFEDVEVMRN